MAAAIAQAAPLRLADTAQRPAPRPRAEPEAVRPLSPSQPPAIRTAMASAPVMGAGSSMMGGSMLGGSGSALPPPVPFSR
jgi:hypothetical protein